MNGHKQARQYSDQMHCHHCSKQWDVNDPEPPPCKDVKPSNRLSPQEQIAKLRRELDLPHDTRLVKFSQAGSQIDSAFTITPSCFIKLADKALNTDVK